MQTATTHDQQPAAQPREDAADDLMFDDDDMIFRPGEGEQHAPRPRPSTTPIFLSYRQAKMR